MSDLWTPLLEPVARSLRVTNGRLLADLFRKTSGAQDAATIAEFTQASVTAVFEAFLDLGGDVENPHAFDWIGQRGALLRAAKEHLREAVTGHGSTYAQYRSRYLQRVHVIKASKHAWTAWDRMYEPASSDVGSAELMGSKNTSRAQPARRDYVSDQDLHLHNQMVAGLEGAVRAAVSPQQADFLIAHYLHDRPQIEIARERLSAQGISTPTEQQLRREENAVNRTLTRARQSAAARLPDVWRDYLQAA